MGKYTDLFFDLDNTLWDFQASSVYALKKIFQQYDLSRYFQSFDEFLSIYETINNQLWDQYRKAQIDKDKVAIGRFLQTLNKKGVNNVGLAQNLSDSYLAYMTEKTFEEPGASETVMELHKRGYRLHIITDGFFEVQIIKIRLLGISQYIAQMIVSEEIGVLKPNPKLFEYAVKKANARIDKSVFIGDDFKNDIIGARNVGLAQVFYNRKHLPKESLPFPPDYVIDSLPELLQIFQ